MARDRNRTGWKLTDRGETVAEYATMLVGVAVWLLGVWFFFG